VVTKMLTPTQHDPHADVRLATAANSKKGFSSNDSRPAGTPSEFQHPGQTDIGDNTTPTGGEWAGSRDTAPDVTAQTGTAGEDQS